MFSRCATIESMPLSAQSATGGHSTQNRFRASSRHSVPNRMVTLSGPILPNGLQDRCSSRLAEYGINLSANEDLGKNKSFASTLLLLCSYLRSSGARIECGD